MVLNQLEIKFSNNKLKEYLFSIEKHETQEEKGTHIHAYLEFNKKIDITNPLFLDLININTKEIFHPHIERVKYKNKTLDYILKDVFNIETETVLISPTLKIYIYNDGKLLDYQEVMVALAEKAKINEVMSILKNKDIDKFMKSHDYTEKSLRSFYPEANNAIAKFDFNKFYLPQELKSNLMNSFIINLNKNPLITNNLDALRSFKEGMYI